MKREREWERRKPVPRPRWWEREEPLRLDPRDPAILRAEEFLRRRPS